MENIEVDIQITPSLHPKIIESVQGYDADTAIYVNSAVESFSTAYIGIQKVYEARAAAEKNSAWNDDSRTLIVAEYADKHLSEITRKFDSSMSNMTKTINAMEDMLKAPLEASAGIGSINSEIRNHVKGLSTKERSAFLSNAHAENDSITLRAVLGAKGFLSGISEVEREARTRMYQEKNAPDVSKRLQVMKAARELMETRGGLVLKEIEKAMGSDWAKVKRLREASGKATAALKFKS